MSVGIVTPMNSVIAWDTDAPNGLSATACLDDFGGSDITASGSDSDNCWTMAGSRLGEPTVTDGTSDKVVLQATFTSNAGVHFVMAGANLPTGSTVTVYSNLTGDPGGLLGTATKCSPNDLWVIYGPTASTGHASWSVVIQLPSAQAIEVPFVGLGGWAQGQGDNIETVGFVREWDMAANPQVTTVGGRAGNAWTRDQPTTYQQRVRINGVHTDGEAQAVFDELLRGSNFHRAVLTIMETDDLDEYGSCCFGRLASLSRYGANENGPTWGLEFTVENAR